MNNFKAEYVNHHNFPVLFGSLLLFFVGISFFDTEDNSLLVELLLFQVFAAGTYTISKSGKIFKSAALIGGIFILLRLAAYYLSDRDNIFMILSIFFMVFFMAIILKNILGYILKTSDVNVNLILGVISGYLLLGVLFSFCFALAEVLEGTAINFESTPEFKDILYFTMITQTTVGYGDLSPISDTARFLSYSLGVVGQLYMGIVMAFIIGKFLQTSPKEKKKL
jgi:voltage-gated potassium channel